MRFDIITLFPDMFGTVFSGGIIKKAMDKGMLDVAIHDLRDYADNKQHQVDDRPFGGSPGMVLKPEPIFSAVARIKKEEEAAVVLLSPQGKRFDNQVAENFARLSQVILICGRYEGVDERVIQHLVTGEISIGDYILTGGEPAAVVIVDSVSRFIPGVVGKMESVKHDSFSTGLLDFPHYTRPRDYAGKKVPDVLFSGDHAKIAAWRKLKSLEKTWKSRPDLLEKRKLSSEEKALLDKVISSHKGKKNEFS